MSETKLPWAPIFTVERSGLPELTVHGIVYAWAEDKSLYSHAGRRLISLGDRFAELWTRSLLKPWQLLNILPVLKRDYPQLTDRHYALMTASQQCDPVQMEVLREILEIGGLNEDMLQCAACRAMSAENAFLQKQDNIAPSPLFNPCAGKHLAHLLYLKATKQPHENYLNPDAEYYQRLKTLLAYLNGKEPEEILQTFDGCGMPNYSLSAVEIAQMYHTLTHSLNRDIVQRAPEEIEPALECWDDLRKIISQNAELFGGRNRLDSLLVSGAWQKNESLCVLAKEGADGLLAVGIGENENFPDGLGILIKLASGYDSKHLETVVMGVLEALELKEKFAPDAKAHLATTFHFEVTKAEPRA